MCQASTRFDMRTYDVGGNPWWIHYNTLTDLLTLNILYVFKLAVCEQGPNYTYVCLKTLTKCLVQLHVRDTLDHYFCGFFGRSSQNERKNALKLPA